MATPTASFFMPITKIDKTAEGHRLVTGVVSSERLDLDGQIADYDWAKKEAQSWFKIANVREMHQRSAVGKGLDLQLDDANRTVSLTSKIVDPVAITKLDEGVYTGYSFGAKSIPGNPIRIVKDAQAPNGRIVSGGWIEITLADRPANPDSTLAVAKVAGGAIEVSDVLGDFSEADVEVEKVPTAETESKTVEPEVTKDGTAVGTTDTYGGGTSNVDVSLGGSVTGAPAPVANGATEHQASLKDARVAIRRLIAEEAGEADPRDNDFQPLVDALNALNCFETAESFEYQYGAMVTQMASIGDKEQRRGLYKQVSEALVKYAEAYKAKLTPPAEEVVKTPTATEAPKTVEPDTEKILTADAIKTVLPDQLKAILPELLKEHSEVLKEALAETFAAKKVEAEVEKLGQRAQPGGPAINPAAAGLRAIEKAHPVNAVVEPGEVPLEALQEMAKYVELAKVDDIPTAQSARRMLAKLQEQYGISK